MFRAWLRRLAVLCVIAAAGYLFWKSYGKPPQPHVPAPAAFSLHSPAFADDGRIPDRYTGKGANLSPPLYWKGTPAGTASFALVMEDLDAPLGTFVHWLLCDLPGSATSLPVGIPNQETIAGAITGVQGVNDFHQIGYGGPLPPPGKPHRYEFTLYALDAPLELPGGFTRLQLREALKGVRVLGEAKLTGTYQVQAE